jgi:hypothetical protein
MHYLRDDFERPCAPGRTLGSRASSGALRLGADVEALIGIDQGALRLQPLLRDGWGRQGIAYGPLTDAPTRAFAVGLLNGHHASHAGDIEQSWGARLSTWLRAGGVLPTRKRVLGWVRAGQHELTARQFASWLLRDPRLYRGKTLEENLAVGLFSSAAPRQLRELLAGFVVHSSGAENGELWVKVGQCHVPVLRQLPNVPLLLVVAESRTHVAYFVASREAGLGGTYPWMRPVALAPRQAHRDCFAGIHQSVLGQIGFRADTRVYGVRVGPLQEATLGVTRSVGNGEEPLQLERPAGLVHLEVPEGTSDAFRIAFGGPDQERAHVLTYGFGRARLDRVEGRLCRTLATEPLTLTRKRSVQIVDAGGVLRLMLDGEERFEIPSEEPLMRVSIQGPSGGPPPAGRLRILERDVLVPEELRVPLPAVARGSREWLRDDFAEPPGCLHGRMVSLAAWRKEMGAARIAVEPGGGARVADARALSFGGRTVYTLPWQDPNFAELEVVVRPPGERRGQGHEGRAGVVFWQDEDNYFIVGTWLHDRYEGASISSFFCLGGFEDIYDAVWTNVGSAISWGTPYRLTVACDGQRFTAYVDGRAVLHRALGDVHRRVTHLRVQRVGIVSNWEWGNDTGSVFESFAASGRGALGEN